MEHFLQLLKGQYLDSPLKLKGSKAAGYRPTLVPLDDVYVRLHLLADKDVEDWVGDESNQGSAAELERRFSHVFARPAERSEPIQLEDVLTFAAQTRPGLVPRASVRLLVLACAGAGKTTAFYRKAAQDWAAGRLWRDMELVFALPMRHSDVHLASDMEQLLRLKRSGVQDPDERVQICTYVSRILPRVCLIMDGLDEVDLDQCDQFVKDVLTGDALRGVRLIVTSRPSTQVLNLAASNPFDRRLEVIGFRSEDVERYVRNVLTPQDADDILVQIAGNPQLASFMQIPLNAANTCMLYRSGVKTLPTTFPSIVSAIMHQILQQANNKKGNTKSIGNNWNDISRELRQPAMELAAFAFRMLVDNVTVFDEHHFKHCNLSDDALSLGSLTVCDDLLSDISPQYVFSHLSLHEGFTARHIAMSIGAGDIPWLVEHLGALTGHLNTFWRFLAAEVDSCSVDALVSSLMTNPPPLSQPKEITTPLTSSQAGAGVSWRLGHFFSATHSEICCLADELASHLDYTKMELLAERLLVDVVPPGNCAVLAVQSSMSLHHELTSGRFLRELLLLWKKRVPQASVNMLRRALSFLDDAAAVECFPEYANCISSNTLPAHERGTVDLATEQGQRTMLLVCHCYHEFSCSRGFSPVLPSLCHVLGGFGRLGFRDIHLTAADCRAVGHVLEIYNDLITTVDFHSCAMEDIGFAQLLPGLQLCTNLTEFFLFGNKLTDCHRYHVSDVIRNNCATLQYLTTGGNRFTSAGNSDAHRYTNQCYSLVCLGIGGAECANSALNCSTVSGILHVCQRIRYAILTEYMLDAQSITHVLAELSSLNLQWLILQRIGLIAQHASAVDHLLQQQHSHLEWISLAGNSLTTAFLEGIRGSFCLCARLKQVHLWKTGLSTPSINVIASMLLYWPNMTELVLTDNDFSELPHEPDELTEAIHSCGSLQSLRLPTNDLVHPELASALSSLRSQRLNVDFAHLNFFSEKM